VPGNHTERKNKGNTAKAAESNEKRKQSLFFGILLIYGLHLCKKRALAALFQVKKSKLKA
jgi:hypothetical protein